MTYRIVSFLISLTVMVPMIVGQQSVNGSVMTFSHSVIAGGGEYSQWTQPNLSGLSIVPNFEVTGTVGQAIAGTTSTGGQFTLHGGFWFADALQPTAAPASIKGRISNLSSLGAIKVRTQVILTDLSTGQTRSTRPNAFGYYHFDDVTVGQMYSIQVSAPGISFDPQSMTISVVADLAGIDFIAVI